MKLKIFDKLRRLFEDKPAWHLAPEFMVTDTILEQKPFLVEMIAEDVTKGQKDNNLGRKDQPTVEQILRAAIYKEMKRLTYEELEFHQYDSELCKKFLKLDNKAFKKSVWQKYFAKIPADKLKLIMEETVKTAIELGYEDCKDTRIDSTVVETNIHKPTNNSLVYDCINTATRLFKKLSEGYKERIENLEARRARAKTNNYKINNIDVKGIARADKKAQREKKMQELFTDSLALLKEIHQEVKQSVLEKNFIALSEAETSQLKELDRQIEIIYNNSYKMQIEHKTIESSEKIYSIFEEHTDIIVKGLRDIIYGHKVNMVTGRSNLILYTKVVDGNPRDTGLFEEPIIEIKKVYEKPIESIATDGGYASLANQKIAQREGILNIVFTKINSGLKNIIKDNDEKIEKALKNWRAGAEAVISNYKRRFDIRRVICKGKKMFDAQIMWAAICYNIRVLTGHIINSMASAM